jgi:hypothetical protein
MTLVDSQTVLQELLHRQNHSDDVLFGMNTWSKFATHIGRVNNMNDSKASAEQFYDTMLQEWIKAHLLFNESIQEIPEAPPTRPAGTISRASKPFLLNHQEFHKSFLLVLEDTLDHPIAPGYHKVCVSYTISSATWHAIPFSDVSFLFVKDPLDCHNCFALVSSGEFCSLANWCKLFSRVQVINDDIAYNRKSGDVNTLLRPCARTLDLCFSPIQVVTAFCLMIQQLY